MNSLDPKHRDREGTMLSACNRGSRVAKAWPADYDENDDSAHGLRAGYLTQAAKGRYVCPSPCGNGSIARGSRHRISTTMRKRSSVRRRD